MLCHRARCLDCDLVDDWYAVDDGSSEEELAAMKAVAPTITWIHKDADQGGHVGSINALFKVASGYDYFVWLEDDWLFVKDGHLVSQAVTVLNNSHNIAQVCAVSLPVGPCQSRAALTASTAVARQPAGLVSDTHDHRLSAAAASTQP